MAQRRPTMNDHILLPASGSGLTTFEPIPHVPAYSLIAWTLRRGSVVREQALFFIDIRRFMRFGRSGEFGQRFCFILSLLQVSAT
jgi:hypothetical protein